MKKSFLTVGPLLAVALFCTQQASASTILFSFDNEDGPVAGTVEGTLELPDGDGTFAATSLIVTALPAALGYTTPFDVLANLTSVLENTFTVIGGSIDLGNSHFSAFFSPDNVIGSSFSLNGNSIPGSSMNIQLSANPFTGIIDSDNSTLTFNSVPEPGTLVVLAMGLGILALGRRDKRKAS